ncbi:hypothetical protein D3C78_1878820 [compost metagenome]
MGQDEARARQAQGLEVIDVAGAALGEHQLDLGAVLGGVGVNEHVVLRGEVAHLDE